MTARQSTFWYSNPPAREWRTTSTASALTFHREIDGYAPTPLIEVPLLAEELGVGRVFLKDESNRLGLPAFKILGASWAVCKLLCLRYDLDAERMTVSKLNDFIHNNVKAEELPVLVTATDGNHGRAVARIAALLGIAARIHIPAGLSSAAIEGIEGEGAKLCATDATYDEVVASAAASVAGNSREVLVQDTAWEGYTQVPQWIVDGYCTLFEEIDDSLNQMENVVPYLVACPVGVGSLAHAMVTHYRSNGKVAPILLTIEPRTAACMVLSLNSGKPVTVDTSLPSIMSGLNCGTPSALSWPPLRAGIDAAVSISEDACHQAVLDLTDFGLDVGPCGAASLAGVREALDSAERRTELGIDSDSVIVLISTEGLAANPLR